MATKAGEGAVRQPNAGRALKLGCNVQHLRLKVLNYCMSLIDQYLDQESQPNDTPAAEFMVTIAAKRLHGSVRHT